MPDNYVTLIGNVTRDPEMTTTTNGATKATIGLAVNRRWQNKATNEWEEQVSFFNIIAWREMADNVFNSVVKGQRIIVAGRLEQRSWTTDTDEKRSIVEVIADEVGPSLRWATAEVVRNPKDGGPVVPRPATVAHVLDHVDEEPF